MASHLVETTLVLVALCVLAIASLRWGLPRFAADHLPRTPLRVLARLRLEPRRTLLVVRVAERTLLLASSEAGLAMLAELTPQEADAFGPAHVSRETAPAAP